MTMADVKFLLVGMSQYSYAEIAALKTAIASFKNLDGFPVKEIYG